jgi:predicted small lipoprotein YifL
MRFALLAALLCTLLCACGQKGPLFIPNDNDAPASSSLR